jgi:hypothetical protein
LEKARIKKANRAFLRKVFTLKTIFYPFMLLLVKTGLIGLTWKIIDRAIRLFGINKSVHYFLKYKDYGKWFTGNFKKSIAPEQEILFPMMFGVHSNFTLLNLLFAKYFSNKENLSPLFYICDSAYDICTKDGLLKSREKYPWFCHECWNGFKYIESKTGIETIRMRNMLMSSEEIICSEQMKIDKLNTLSECYNYEHNGIEIGRIARKSVLRYFLVGNLTESDEVLGIFKMFLISGLRYSIAFNYLLNLRTGIKYVILNNGSLTFEAIARVHCEKRSIAYMTYETYIGNNSLIYKKNGPVMDLDWAKEYDSFIKSFALDDMAKDMVSGFFANLQKGVEMYAVLNIEHKAEKLEEVKRYACLFTNLNYDTAVIDKNFLFENMEEWILSVIDYWKKNNSGVTLVIRIHPGELKLVTASKEFLGNRLRKASRNNDKIIVFDSDEKVDSYELIKGMEYGLIYSSTIGLEIAWKGKTCLVAGLPWFRNKSFVVFPHDRQGYFSAINSLNEGSLGFVPNENELYRTIYFVYFNRNKRLKGIKLYTPKEEANNDFENSGMMISENIVFFNELRNELFSSEL